MTRAHTPSIPPLIEADEAEYRDSGVPSTVAIFGHPLHPLLVTFPLAFLTGALGTDVGYWLTGDSFWARASFWLIGVGIATGLVAAATVMSDFARIDRVREHSAGWAHMVGNVAALTFSAVNFWLRWNGSFADRTNYFPSGGDLASDYRMVWCRINLSPQSCSYWLWSKA